MAGKINQLAAVMRALNHQRVPSIAARLIRKLDESPAAARFRVVGTHALYAYEAAAAVTFNGEMVATGDLDVLIYDRAPLRIAIDGEARGLEAIARSVDPSFQQRQKGDFRLINKDGLSRLYIMVRDFVGGRSAPQITPPTPMKLHHARGRYRSIPSDSVSASSRSTPRYLTVLSILVWPSSSWTARRLPVFL